MFHKSQLNNTLDNKIENPEKSIALANSIMTEEVRAAIRKKQELLSMLEDVTNIAVSLRDKISKINTIYEKCIAFGLSRGTDIKSINEAAEGLVPLLSLFENDKTALIKVRKEFNTYSNNATPLSPQAIKLDEYIKAMAVTFKDTYNSYLKIKNDVIEAKKIVLGPDKQTPNQAANATMQNRISMHS